MLAESLRNIQLREILPDDFDFLRRLRLDVPLQHTLMAHPQGQDDADVRRWIERRKADRNGLFRLIVASDQPAGFVQIVNAHGIDRYAYLGICIAPELQGAGLGGAAMQLALEAAVHELGLRKILIEVRCDNTRALQLYRRLGFSDVGVLASHYFDGEKYVDVAMMEIMLERLPS